MSPEDPPAAREPVVLNDRYELGEKLGSGGMADVYRAVDPVLGRPVAVKVLRETTENASDRARFTREAMTLAGLMHRNLVIVLDAGITAEQPFIVMELVEGTTLAHELGDRCTLPAERVALIGRQLADALAYTDARGVVHRDMKPGNVLLTAGDEVKLADFGIARLIGDTVRHTQTGHAIGTAAYLAPEQVRGDEVTAAVDVYSLGLVLLECLTGQRSYPGTPTEAALARLHRQPEIPSSVPAQWRALVGRMTALDPVQRPSATEAASDLQALAHPTNANATRLLSMPPPEPDGRRGLAARAADMDTHQRGVAAAVAALLLLLVVTAVAAGVGSGGGDAPAESVPVPDRTPARLEQPLQDLHDAIAGAGQ